MGEPGGNCIKAAKTINYAETELGKIGLISGRDCWHPEIGRVMALEKVEIVLAVNRMGFNESFPANCWQQMAGIWSQVQQNQFIALEASLGGQNLVHGPCEITPYRTGILAPVGKEENARKKSIEPYFEDISGVYSEVDGFKVITAEIDINGLKRIQSSYPLLKHLNPSLYCKEMRGWRRI
jgi:predicted amidohydrolase